jgi:DNA-binding NarL/FixJ family response regulator
MIHSPPYDTASDIPEMLTADGSDAVESDEIEVIVIDDHLSMRKGLELLLRQEGLRVAGVAGGLEEARALLERRRHDVALIDVHLGTENSLGLVEERLRSHPDAAIVLYTGYTEGLAGAARIGARGFVLKSSPASHLIDALRAVAGGGHYVDENLAGALVEHTSTALLSVLSARELQILDLLADGLNGQAIAKLLFLSPETVRTHVRNATTKLGARTRVQAVALVVRGRSGR